MTKLNENNIKTSYKLMASMNYFNSSRENRTYTLNGNWKSVIISD